uniref:Transposase n=1 Tax=Vibrio harveyi TaxID=669 RepID=E5G5G7_VIBHA|nr:hypothetical protein [Vibrio harveyi]
MPFWQKLSVCYLSERLPPLGTHRKRVDNRDAMNGILFVLRTDCQWNVSQTC